MTLTDSLLQVIAHKDSLLSAAMARVPAHHDTVAVKVIEQHLFVGLVGDVAKVVLGAVLALGTSWWMESRRRAEDDRRARRPLKIRVETEAHLVLLALKRLVDSLNGSDENPQNTLKEMKPLLESFDRVQDRLYLLRHPAVETGLGVWYRKLRITAEQAVNADLYESLGISLVEGLPPAPPNQERASYRTRFSELLSKGNQLLDQIRKLD